MFYEGVLLMDLVRDAEGRPAPRLIDVAIERDAAIGVYADLVAQMISMLCCDLIHGDLSPYNILAAADGPTIIDFPQVVSAVHSSRAEYFFLRDFDNIVRFFVGLRSERSRVHAADGRAIWRAYVARELTPRVRAATAAAAARTARSRIDARVPRTGAAAAVRWALATASPTIARAAPGKHPIEAPRERSVAVAVQSSPSARSSRN